MNCFKFFYSLASAMWIVFSINLIAWMIGKISFEYAAMTGILLIAVLQEELYYKTEGGGIKHASKV